MIKSGMLDMNLGGGNDVWRCDLSSLKLNLARFIVKGRIWVESSSMVFNLVKKVGKSRIDWLLSEWKN